jgi:hypothetical protein
LGFDCHPHLPDAFIGMAKSKREETATSGEILCTQRRPSPVRRESALSDSKTLKSKRQSGRGDPAQISTGAVTLVPL